MSRKTVYVWDWCVRLTHWSLASCVLLNLLFTEDGSSLHEWVGYTALVVVLLRLFWGLITSNRFARLSQLLPKPSKLSQHLTHLWQRQTLNEQALGHNPLASLMVITLWGVVIGLAVTGYMMGTDVWFGEEWLEETHEVLANSLYLLVPVHVIAAIVMSYWQKSNHIAAMLTGYKRLPTDQP